MSGYTSGFGLRGKKKKILKRNFSMGHFGKCKVIIREKCFVWAVTSLYWTQKKQETMNSWTASSKTILYILTTIKYCIWRAGLMWFPLLRYTCSDSFSSSTFCLPCRRIPDTHFRVLYSSFSLQWFVTNDTNQNTQAIFHSLQNFPAVSCKETEFITLVMCEVQGKLRCNSKWL